MAALVEEGRPIVRGQAATSKTLDDDPMLDVMGDTQLDEQTQALLARILSNEEEEDEAHRPSVLCANTWFGVNVSVSVLYIAVGITCLLGFGLYKE